MERLTIVLSTRNRWNHLRAFLTSIPRVKRVGIHIHCDGDKQTYDSLRAGFLPGLRVPTVLTVDEHRGSIASRNRYISRYTDGVLYAVDDITFLYQDFDKLIETYNDHFPNDDGVLGLSQDQDHHLAGVGIVGQRFLDMLPGRFLFFPGYYHFGCQEIMWLAEHYNRFAYMKNPTIIHHKQLMQDQAGIDARVHRGTDHALIKARQNAGLIWGLTNEKDFGCLRPGGEAELLCMDNVVAGNRGQHPCGWIHRTWKYTEKLFPYSELVTHWRETYKGESHA